MSNTLRNVVLIFLSALPFQSHAVEFGVFSDFNFLSDPEEKNNKGHNHEYSFALGQLDLFATQEVSKQSKAFIELVVEDSGDGFVIDLERLWIKYAFSNAFSVAGGRFHTPIGFWNNNYHHGSLIQDTVSRPFFLDFEDGDAGILPVHTVGLRFAGRATAGNGLFSYDALVANGSALDTTEDGAGNFLRKEILVNNTYDPGDDPAYVLALSYEYTPAGIEYGLFGMKNDYTGITGNDQAVGLYDQLIYGSHLRFNQKYFYLLAETFFMVNSVVNTEEDAKATAWYAQLGFHLSESFSLILRHAELDYEPGDLYFRILLDDSGAEIPLNQNVAALRYDIDESNAVKLEYNEIYDHSKILLQWSFLLF